MKESRVLRLAMDITEARMAMSTLKNGDDAKRHKDNPWSEKQVFTTGEAAEVCNVSQQTIIRCFDNGRLQGFRVPGSRFRRIPRAELIRFMKDNDIPTSVLEESTVKRVLVVDDDEEIAGMLRDILARDERFKVEVVGNGYDAGRLTELFRPHLVLLDYMLPDINGNLVCKRLRENPNLYDTRVIVISGVVAEDEIQALLDAGADAFIKKPFDLDELMSRIDDLLGSS